MIVDAAGLSAAPGALLVEGGRIIAAGTPQEVGAIPGVAAVDFAHSVIMPALVNAHTHLDLTHIGPFDFDGHFAAWADIVRSRRHHAAQAIADSVRSGVELCRAGGTAAVGDIAGAGSPVPIRVQREMGLPGVSFLEIFGVGRAQAASFERLTTTIAPIARDASGVRLGVQPHAPYSIGPDLYASCATLGLPLATHLAETLEEIEFTRSASGPLADLLRRIGVWDETIRPAGRHPIEYVCDRLAGMPFLAAHINYPDDRHLEMLAESGVSVAYCPRASAYFGHPHAGLRPHRYREMLAAGANVALGTDSIICLDTADRISVLDEMRFLFQRDATDPHLLLRMATMSGARALGLELSRFTLAPKVETLGAIAVPFDPATRGATPFERALRGSAAPRWVVSPTGVPSSTLHPALP